MTTTGFLFTLAQDAAPPGPFVPGAPANPSQTGTQQPDPGLPAPGTPGGGGGGLGGFNMLLPLLVVMVLFVLMTGMSGRKERKKRAELLAGIGKNDRIQTMGGIIGTVVELTDQEMVLRVDEASNTRIRFARSAVQQVLRSARDKGSGNGTDLEVKPAVPTRV